MNKRGNWGAMAERVAAAAPVAPAEAQPVVRAASRPQPPPREPSLPEPLNRLRHCWVVDGQGRLPALLLEWRRTGSGFQGRVVRPVNEVEVGWIVVEEWLPAELLEPT